MDKKKIIVFLIIAIFAIILVIKNEFIGNKESDFELENFISNQNQENLEENENTKVETETIKIHITGEINNPGIIELNAGDRVSDAIEKAGGATQNADLSKVNLAYILSDGEKIYIPNYNDEEDVKFTVSSEGKNNKVNINTADLEVLQKLSGIGKSTAEAIIEYREKNGKFSSIDDIKNVSGIGESKFEKIKDDICVK